MKIPKAGTLVIVEWEDASSHDTWAEIDEAVRKSAHLANVKTAGWFKGVENKCVLLVCSAAFSGQEIVQTSTLYRIPLGCVKRIVRVTAG